MTWFTTYRRDAVTSPGVGSWAITGLTRTYAPVSPLCEGALGHVTRALFLITCLFAAKLPIILMFRQKLVSNTHNSSFILSYFVFIAISSSYTHGRDAISASGPGANFTSSTEFSCTFCPFSPVSVRAFGHVTRPFLLISCLWACKLTIILEVYRKVLPCFRMT